ncbi:MAG TPA: AAA family ATPase [Brevundimonas sp.]
MELSSVSVTGFRRFKKTATLQTNGKLVALLGPNEAGKSSLLAAIVLLANDLPPAAQDYTRGVAKTHFALVGRYFLDDHDLEAAGLVGNYWLHITKGQEGTRNYALYPNPPSRDRGPRTRLLSAIDALVAHPKFLKSLSDDEKSKALGDVADVRAILTSDAENISAENLQVVANLANSFEIRVTDKLPAPLQKLSEHSARFAETEAEPDPNAKAMAALLPRVPGVVSFDEGARTLVGDYALDELRQKIPPALDNLADLAEVSVKDIIAAHDRGSSDLMTIQARANAQLEKRFREDWKQSGISVSVRVGDGRLEIHIVNEGSQYTPFAERSDGLRLFVALAAFTGGKWAGKPVLLIDEAEQRLHYDAQADLVQMLARQTVASKVIYTTHSAGCLPEDLGMGVRLTRPDRADPTLSEIENRFWASDPEGFTPLLFGMGAATMAFFPTRHAVMVEGPADMLLMPTMIRAALDRASLGVQFVPGLSSTADFQQSPVIGTAKGMLYLVDGDAGGDSIKTRLVKNGVRIDDIIVVKSPNGNAAELEDFLHVSLLVDGANRLLSRFHPESSMITQADLGVTARMAALEKAFRSKSGKTLSKVNFAYSVLDLLLDNPKRTLFDARTKPAFVNLAAKTLNYFRL